MIRRARWDIPERGRNRAVYVNRHVLEGPVRDCLHCHDFAEILFGTEGQCRHAVNDREEPFAAGELLFIRPNDAHQMHVEAGKRFVYYIVGFQPSVLKGLRRQFPEAMAGFWDTRPARLCAVGLTLYQRQWLSAEIRALSGRAGDAFFLQRFLINLTYEIQRLRRGGYEQAPDWLRQAIHEMEDIANARRGPRVLATLSGRSFEHVSRVLKKNCNLTPSQLVNRIRVEYAAGQLVLGPETVLRIALDAGFGSLGHFYREFRNVYGMTPRQYRILHRTPFGQGRGQRA